MIVLTPTNHSLGERDPVGEALRKYRMIAVVGLSSKRYRPSYGVAEYMQS